MSEWLDTNKVDRAEELVEDAEDALRQIRSAFDEYAEFDTAEDDEGRQMLLEMMEQWSDRLESIAYDIGGVLDDVAADVWHFAEPRLSEDGDA